VTTRSFIVDSSEPDAPLIAAVTGSGSYTSGMWTGEDVTVTVSGGGNTVFGYLRI
jgi:hypothetical protein